MVEAIKLVLRERGFRAGERRIGYQSCNDTVGKEPFDEGLCERNARAYAAAEDVLGVIGPWNSGCAYVQIPILSREDAGPLAVISPSNTYVGLTRGGPGANPGDPERLYPDGVRNYVRLVPSDVAQGAALAAFADARRMRRVVTITDRADAYASSVAGSFLEEARRRGLRTAAFAWKPQASFRDLARRVARTRPKLVYLTGLPQLNAKRLLEDLRAALGPDVEIAGSDSFLEPALAAALGPLGDGLLATQNGYPPERLPPGATAFLKRFGKAGYKTASGYGAPEAAQAAEVLLDAIGRSDGSRASIVDELFATRVENGILGTFGFDRNGDVDPATATIHRLRNGTWGVEGIVRVPSTGP